MGYPLTVRFDIEEHGYHFEITPSTTPMWMTVEVLLGFLEDIKKRYDAAPVLNRDDARAWQMLGRLDRS